MRRNDNAPGDCRTGLTRTSCGQGGYEDPPLLGRYVGAAGGSARTQHASRGGSLYPPSSPRDRCWESVPEVALAELVGGGGNVWGTCGRGFHLQFQHHTTERQMQQ